MSRRDPAPTRVRDARSVALRTLWIDRTSRALLAELEAAGVPTILLKGPSTARWLYEPGERDYADLDVLVDAADLPTVDRVLQAAGYVHPRAEARPTELDDHALTYITNQPAGSRLASDVDVHYTLRADCAPPAVVWRRLREVTAPFPLAGGTVTALDEIGRALVIVLHAARDAGRKPQSMEDLRRLVRVLPDDAWPRVVTLARDLDALEPFAAGLLLLDDGTERLRHLEIPEPTRFATLLNRPDVPFAAKRVEELAAARGLRAKVRLALEEVWPSASWLRWWAVDVGIGPTPLPVLRVRRVMHVVRAAGPAMRAHRRVRREVRGRQQQPVVGLSRPRPPAAPSAPAPRPGARAGSR